jgi:hypothetical protein
MSYGWSTRSKKKATRNSPKFKAKRSGQAKRDTPALGKEREMAQAADERKSSPKSTILTVEHLRRGENLWTNENPQRSALD